MNRTFLATYAALAAATFTLPLANRAVADVNFPYQQIKFDYKPQNDKDSVVVVDPSTIPPTPLQYFKILLEDSGVGTPQNPLGPLAASATLGIVNPDPLGLGDAAFADIGWRLTGSNENPVESFFHLVTQINDPGTGQPTAMKKGTVKFFNESKGFSFVVGGQAPGQPEFDYLLRGDINPAQTGLTFAGPPDVQGGGPTFDSFFDIFTELHFDGSAPTNPNVPLFSLTLTQVPEPSTIVLAGVGLLGLGLATLRKKYRRV